MRKRTSFLATRFTVPFSHGKDPHTFKVLRISSAADGKQMSLSHAQCAFSDATAWKRGCQLWNATPHMLYPTWIFSAHMSSMRVDFKIFSPALCKPTQSWRQTRIHHGLYRSEHSQNQPLACKQMFFLILVLGRWVPHFSCSALGVEIPGDQGESAVSFIISSFSTFCSE